jgi:hypothetical protein
MHYHRPQRSGAGLEALFIGADIAVKVILKEPVDSRPLRMPRSILSGRIRNEQARPRSNTIVDFLPNATRQTGWARVPGHGWQQTSRGLRAAIGLTAGAGFEPRYRKRAGA